MKLLYFFFAYNKIGFCFKKWKWEEIVQHFANANEIKTRNAINRVCFFLDFFKVDFFVSSFCFLALSFVFFGGGGMELENGGSYCSDWEIILLKN